MIIPVAAQIYAKWLQFHASLATAAAYKNTPGLFFLSILLRPTVFPQVSALKRDSTNTVGFCHVT
jgi:hypothetical protein